jgi:hypothetical protein
MRASTIPPKPMNYQHKREIVPFITTSRTRINMMAYSLKGRTVEPERQALLANDPETTFFSR